MPGEVRGDKPAAPLAGPAQRTAPLSSAVLYRKT